MIKLKVGFLIGSSFALVASVPKTIFGEIWFSYERYTNHMMHRQEQTKRKKRGNKKKRNINI